MKDHIFIYLKWIRNFRLFPLESLSSLLTSERERVRMETKL